MCGVWNGRRQVQAFLHPTARRKAPPGWWCRPEQTAAHAASAPAGGGGSKGALAKQRDCDEVRTTAGPAGVTDAAADIVLAEVSVAYLHSTCGT